MKNMICTFGDSIMKGVVSSQKDVSGRPLYQVSEQNFVNRCRQRFGINIRNYACYGSTTTQGMKYINRHEKEVKEADYILFEYGGNDCDYDWKSIAASPSDLHLPKNPLDVFVCQYQDLIKKIRNLNGNPVIMSLPLIDPDRFFDHLSLGLNRDNILSWLGGRTMHLYQWHEMYNVELFKMARRLRVPIIDVTSPFLELRNYSDFLCDDGIHPNEKGHALIAETIENNYGAIFD